MLDLVDPQRAGRWPLTFDGWHRSMKPEGRRRAIMTSFVLNSQFLIDANVEGDEGHAVSVDRVHSVLQFLDGGVPLEQREVIVSLLVASKLKRMLAVSPDEHGHEAVREPVSSLAPEADVLDQRQELIATLPDGCACGDRRLSSPT